MTNIYAISKKGVLSNKHIHFNLSVGKSTWKVLSLLYYVFETRL